MSEKYTPFKMKGHELPGPNQRTSPAKETKYNVITPTKKLGRNITHPTGPAAAPGSTGGYKKASKVSRASDYDKDKSGKGR